MATTIVVIRTIEALPNAGQEPPERSSTTSLTPSQHLVTNYKRRKVTTEKTWYGLGWLVTKRTQFEMEEDGKRIWSEAVEIERKFLPAAWSFLPALGYFREMACGDWKHSFPPICMVPDDSPGFEACIKGDLNSLISLIDSGCASIHDTSHDGWTLLHVSCPETPLLLSLLA